MFFWLMLIQLHCQSFVPTGLSHTVSFSPFLSLSLFLIVSSSSCPFLFHHLQKSVVPSFISERVAHSFRVAVGRISAVAEGVQVFRTFDFGRQSLLVGEGWLDDARVLCELHISVRGGGRGILQQHIAVWDALDVIEVVAVLDDRGLRTRLVRHLGGGGDDGLQSSLGCRCGPWVAAWVLSIVVVVVGGIGAWQLPIITTLPVCSLPQYLLPATQFGSSGTIIAALMTAHGTSVVGRPGEAGANLARLGFRWWAGRVLVESSVRAGRRQVARHREIVVWPRHVEPGVGRFLQGGGGLSHGVVGELVGLWVLEGGVVLQGEVGLQEVEAFFHTGKLVQVAEGDGNVIPPRLKSDKEGQRQSEILNKDGHTYPSVQNSPCAAQLHIVSQWAPVVLSAVVASA